MRIGGSGDMHILSLSRFIKGKNSEKKKKNRQSQRYSWGSVRCGGSLFEMFPRQFNKWFSKVMVLPIGWTEFWGWWTAD